MSEPIKLGDVVRVVLGGELNRTRYVVVSDRCRNGFSQAGYWIRPRHAPATAVGSFARESILQLVERAEARSSDGASA